MRLATIILTLFFLTAKETLALSDLVRYGKEPPDCFCRSGDNYRLITGNKYRDYKWLAEERALIAIGHRRRLEVAFKPDGNVWFALETGKYRFEIIRLEFQNDWREFSYIIGLQKKNNDGVLEPPEVFEGEGRIERGGAWEECFNKEQGVERGDSWERWVFNKRFIFSRIKIIFYYRDGRFIAVDY